MEITQDRHGAVTVLKPHGPLVQTDVDQFKQAVRRATEKSLGRFVIDASEVAYADSRGLEVLVDATRELSASGQVLRLAAVTETLREILDLTDLTRLFELHEDVNSGVRSFL